MWVFAQMCNILSSVIIAEGVLVKPLKVEVVLKCELHTIVTEVRSFIGLVGYYQCFIEGLSKLALLLII